MQYRALTSPKKWWWNPAYVFGTDISLKLGVADGEVGCSLL